MTVALFNIDHHGQVLPDHLGPDKERAKAGRPSHQITALWISVATHLRVLDILFPSPAQSLMEQRQLLDSPVPEADILFLGGPGVGKATFLSRLEHTRNGRLEPSEALNQRVFPPSNPLTFDVTLFRRPYKFHIYTSTSTLFIDPFPPEPAFAIIAFSIPSRASLYNAQHYWRKQLSLHYDHLEHTMPIMLLGLKRDERTEKRLEDGSYECVMPQEGLRAAQEMRCDRYAECSAVTGELMWEVLEDITKTAAKTTTEAGGLSHDSSCSAM